MEKLLQRGAILEFKGIFAQVSRRLAKNPNAQTHSILTSSDLKSALTDIPGLSLLIYCSFNSDCTLLLQPEKPKLKPKPVSEPSPYKHPKYQAHSILNCPHDLKPCATETGPRPTAGNKAVFLYCNPVCPSCLAYLNSTG